MRQEARPTRRCQRTCSPGRIRPGLRAKRAMRRLPLSHRIGTTFAPDTLASLAGRTNGSAPTRAFLVSAGIRTRDFQISQLRRDPGYPTFRGISEAGVRLRLVALRKDPERV